MNILNLLKKENFVAGIEISDSVVRIAFFRPQKKRHGSGEAGDKEDEFVLIEEPIAANIIEDGAVVDVDLLGKTLRNIWAKAELGTNYAVIAIPDDKIYSKIFSFPKSVNDTRLTEAMRLAINFQLPMKLEEVYLDWERTAGTATTNEILLSTIPRTVAEGYVRALEQAGIKTLALESHLAAIARAIKIPSGDTILFSKKTPDGTTIFTLKDGVLRFSRTLPYRFVPEEQIPNEIKKIKSALSAEEGKEITEQDLLEATVCDEYATRDEITAPKSKWLVALGAAIRSKIPEGKDNLISLLPVGTEEAYAYQRATTFIVVMRNLVISVSLFFIITYLSMYLFMYSLSKNTTESIATLSASAMPPELAEKEHQISEINAMTEVGAAFLSQMPMWSKVLNEIVAVTPKEIVITQFSGPNFVEKFFITGSAANRVALNSYKKILQESPLLSEVDLPLTNLEQKGQIPFAISFRLKDPGALYYPQDRNSATNTAPSDSQTH